MDPSENLHQLRTAILDGDRTRSEELFTALDGWLSTGGFLPVDWAGDPVTEHPVHAPLPLSPVAQVMSRVNEDPHYLQRWVVLAIGCAECNEEPLVIPKGTFDSENEALASTGIDDPNVFGVHPDGGVIFQTRSGAVWIFPIEVLATVSTAEAGW